MTADKNQDSAALSLHGELWHLLRGQLPALSEPLVVLKRISSCKECFLSHTDTKISGSISPRFSLSLGQQTYIWREKLRKPGASIPLRDLLPKQRPHLEKLGWSALQMVELRLSSLSWGEKQVFLRSCLKPNMGKITLHSDLQVKPQWQALGRLQKKTKPSNRPVIS